MKKEEAFLRFKLQNSNSVNQSGLRKFGEIKVPFSRPGKFGEYGYGFLESWGIWLFERLGHFMIMSSNG